MTVDNRVDVRLIWVTPEMAEEWLKRRPPNRRIRVDMVNKYAEDMRAGRWEVNGETIVLNDRGEPLDGQHRLMAVCAAGRPVPLLVATGVDPGAFVTIDSGKSRSFADVLAIQGYKDTATLASAVRIYYCYKETKTFDDWRPIPPTFHQLQQLVEEIGDQIKVAMSATHKVHRVMGGSHGVYAVVYMTLDAIDPVDNRTFFARFADGQNLQEGDPIYALRRVLGEARSRNRGMTALRPNILSAYIIKAWNKYRAHEPVKLLTYRAGEDFPTPI